MNAEAIEIIDNDFQRQFEAEIEGESATIEYVKQERKIFLTKLVMSDDLKEKGHLTPFIKAVLEELKGERLTVMPTSPDVVKFFRTHKDYKKMLPTGINI